LRKLMDSAGDMTAGDLAREWHYDSGAMTRMLDRLEEKGLIRRKRSQTDRRSVLVRLTAKGRALDEHISRVAIEVLNIHLQNFSAQEADQFKDFLRRMIAHG
jgi:DNA-binding MarR family transcriptional regulator